MLLKVSHAVIMDTEFAIRLEPEDGELDIGLIDAAAQPGLSFVPCPAFRATLLPVGQLVRSSKEAQDESMAAQARVFRS